MKVIKPYLDFFVFKGSGQGKSDITADRVLEFKSFDNLTPEVYGVNILNIIGKKYISA